MGDFRVVVDAVGSHGCERDIGHDSHVVGCERPGCSDCIAREYVRRLKRCGILVRKAVIIHWPDSKEKVTDNLVTGKRTGWFPEYPRYHEGSK